MVRLPARRELVLPCKSLWALALLCCLGLAQNAPNPKNDAVGYLNRALDEIQNRALHRSTVDWPRVRAEALSRAKNAKTPVDTYDAIRFALAGLKDHHSSLLLTPALESLEAQRNPHRVAPKAPPPTAASSPYSTRSSPEGRIEKQDGKIFGLVVVPKCASQNDQQSVEYETRLQRVIADLDRSHPKAWVIDLRGNGGANVWPMLAGIAPLLGESDNLVQFLTTRGRSVWRYRNGAATEIVNGNEVSHPAVEGSPHIVQGNPTVAVLIDSGTAVAGEALAIAFRARPNTRFFGEYTAGRSTVSETVALPDGASMSLIIGIQADRTGKEYLDGLGPDELIPGADRVVADADDQALQSALWWLSHLP
ncbi:MAG TPA: S41 family peptidase [Terriglobales bacterium]